MKLIETSHGTVCERCLLWPDLCACDGKSEVIEALVNLFGVTTKPPLQQDSCSTTTTKG